MPNKPIDRQTYALLSVFGGWAWLHGVYTGSSPWCIPAALVFAPLTSIWGMGHGAYWMFARSDADFARRFGTARGGESAASSPTPTAHANAATPATASAELHASSPVSAAAAGESEEQAKERWLQYERDLKQARAREEEERKAALRREFGEDADAVIHARLVGHPAIGMPERVVYAAFGYPGHRISAATKTISREKCYYLKRTNKSGNAEYGLEVIFENDKVAAWREGTFRPRS